MLYLVFLLSEFITSALGAVEIVRGPLTVPNATIGGTASFECILNSVSAFPLWNINGVDYVVTLLPPGFDFERTSYSNVLSVSPVQPHMNNTCVYCFLLFINDRRVESSRAKLIIPPPIPSYSSSWQTSTTVMNIVSTHSRLHTPNTAGSASDQGHSSVTDLTYNVSSSGPNHHNSILIGVSTAAAVALSIIICAIGSWIYCHHRNKGSDVKQKAYPVYEEVPGAVVGNPVLHDNPAYANPLRMRLEDNPAYISTHKPLSPSRREHTSIN